MEEKDKVLNNTVVKLGLVSLFADISSEMLYPVTPIFLTTVLGASVSSVGIIEGFAEGLASLLKTYSGVWSDRILRRTPFVAFGYFLSAIAKPFVGMSSSWGQVFSARALDRTGKGIRTAPRDALLADSVSVKLRGAAFGWHRAMDTIGAAIGPLFAAFYLSNPQQNLRSLYYWALVPGLIAVVICFLLKEKKIEIKNHKPLPRFFDFKNFSRSFKIYLSSWGIFSLANSSDVFLLLKAKAEGVGATEIILLYCAYNFVYAILSPYLGGLSDRIGRKKLLIFGLMVFACVYLGFSVATERWQFWLLFAFYGLYMAASDGVGKALAVDLIEPNFKASAIGAVGTVTGLAALVASIAAGQIWEHIGPSYAFMYGAFGALAAAVLLLRVSEKENIAMR